MAGLMESVKKDIISVVCALTDVLEEEEKSGSSSVSKGIIVSSV